jgi:hypothetical protein
LFVEMLRRISALGSGVADGGTSSGAANEAGAPDSPTVLPPLQTLDGFGVLAPPPPTAQPIPAAKAHDIVPSLDHPPGYYGAGGSPHAINVLGPKSSISPLPPLPTGTEHLNYQSESAQPMKSWLLLAALALLFADIIAVIILQAGGLALWRGPRRGAAHAALALAVIGAATVMLGTPGAHAQVADELATQGSAVSKQAADERAIEATSKVTIGYVLTGDQGVDEISRLGLDGLGRLLAVRTAVEPGRPMGVNILTDEIAFFPVLYWPVLPDAKALPEETLAKIDAYMKQGGLIIFDTQDYGTGAGAAPGQGESALQRIIGKLDVPRLEPVPENHVLTKAFYLLRNFPGRWDGGQLWVEALEGSSAPRPRFRRRHVDHRHPQRPRRGVGAG